MAEFDDKLSAILSDDAAMGQIMALAQSLSGGGGELTQGEEGPPAAGCPPPERDAALLGALRPYLRQERRERLDRMLEMLRLLRLLRRSGG